MITIQPFNISAWLGGSHPLLRGEQECAAFPVELCLRYSFSGFLGEWSDERILCLQRGPIFPCIQSYFILCIFCTPIFIFTHLCRWILYFFVIFFDNSAFSIPFKSLVNEPVVKIWGFGAVILACFTSGFAGVWIQKMLQQTSSSESWLSWGPSWLTNPKGVCLERFVPGKFLSFW